MIVPSFDAETDQLILTATDKNIQPDLGGVDGLLLMAIANSVTNDWHFVSTEYHRETGVRITVVAFLLADVSRPEPRPEDPEENRP